MRFLKEHGPFLGILGVTIVLHVLRIGQTDLLSDNSLNALRSFGWVDYLGSGSGQLGPLEWYGHTSWWTSLSFQDAPPLAFFFQHISFLVFGDSAFAAQFPFVLAGVLTVLMIYVGVSFLVGRTSALWSAGALAVSSFALWSSENSFLEGIETFFATLAFLLLAAYLQKGKARFLYGGAFVVGCALLSKYTALFLIPAFLAAFFFEKTATREAPLRSTNSLAELAGAVGIGLLTLAPVVMYNIQLIVHRGLLDTALAAMLGLPNDLGRMPNFDFITNQREIFQALFATSSWPFMGTCLLFAFFLVLRVQKAQSTAFETVLVSVLCFLILQFGCMGGGVRWLSLAVPFLAIAFGCGSSLLCSTPGTRMIRTLLVAVLLLELLYACNTNILPAPVGLAGSTYSIIREQSLGFNELDAYLRQRLAPLPLVHPPNSKEELEPMDLSMLKTQSAIVLYDRRIEWFATRWYFERYRVYYRLPFYSTISPIRAELLGSFSLDALQRSGVTGTVYFVYPNSQRVMSPERQNSKVPEDAFADSLTVQDVPSYAVFDREGRLAFTVFTLTSTSSPSE